ncbi:MAG TPA: nucleotidyltransferase domain-containing protein [Spirochaetia bacterium]|nr:nucleotidyltransferase domain-containing protein [Spirochaetia bacterium]
MPGRQSIIHKRSSGSVTIFWLDREALLANLREAAHTLFRDRPEVSSIVLFGSAANGRAVPGSDADVMIVARDLEVRPLDRPLVYMPYFEGVGLGVELFVYTEAELGSAAPGIARTALKTGITLFSRKVIDWRG